LTSELVAEGSELLNFLTLVGSQKVSKEGVLSVGDSRCEPEGNQ
jgi:hypothetical protein